MQRPRRTSEFFDETSAASSTRKTRTTQRLPSTPSTVQKYSTRRTALGTRNSSDRGLLTSASRGTTPSRSHSASRSLFSTSTACGGALHNDKKWVQDQTQRITDHLKQASLLGYGYLDFINQNGLRQMTIKQFVAVVNYFLHFIAGNRLIVGTNHVDDIVNVLQNVQYPYAINKSWLKTPNTQHSFGNVVVLLSWLLDFVPPIDNELDLECFFPLQDNQDTKNTNEPPCFIADNNFHLQMIRHCEEGFALWNNELMKEYVDMQKKTCDLYINKRTNFSNAIALEREIQQLVNHLESLKKNCISVPKTDIEQNRRLIEQREYLLKCQKILFSDLEHISEILQTFESKLENCKEDVQQLEKDVAQLRHKIQQQKYTAVERDSLIDQVDILKHTLQSQESTLCELQDQSYRKQVQLSRLKKKQNDDIQQFNAHMRKINEITINTQAIEVDCSRFQLPLNVKQEQLKNTIDVIVQINNKIIEKLAEKNKNIIIISRAVEHNEEKIVNNIQREYEMTVLKLLLMEKTLKQQETHQHAYLENLIESHQLLKIKINQIEIIVAQKVASNSHRNLQLISNQNTNERIMLEAEQINQLRVNQHEQTLNNFEKQLDENITELLQLQKIVVENDNLFSTFK